MPQIYLDDDERKNLDLFFQQRDQNTREMIEFFRERGQYWKARVFLEMLWELERLLNEKNNQVR